MRLHASLTEERIVEAAEIQMFDSEMIGFCTACGADAYGCEPDAERYPCEVCGANRVYGAERLLLEVL
jgi:hypothetical protein